MDIFIRKTLPPKLCTARLILREVNLIDISDELIWWLNDSETNKFLEVRHSVQTRELVEKYVSAKLNDLTNPHFGVYDNEGKRLVGTTTVNLYNPHHNVADISFVIGHPEARRKGYATESVHAVCAYMFEVKAVHKITGGLYANNIASQRVFEKNGFSLEGVRRQQYFTNEKVYVDALLYGLLGEEFEPNFKLLGGNSINIHY